MKIIIEKPIEWDDLKAGDSIAVNGICLTLENDGSEALQFSLGPETINVTGWRPKYNEKVNLERSLRFGDRVHGHLVNGHVDDTGRILAIEDRGETKDLTIETSQAFTEFVWRKGSVAVHGVSLTVNEAKGGWFRVGLIPETLRRTNLNNLRVGDRVHLEADAMARAWRHANAAARPETSENI